MRTWLCLNCCDGSSANVWVMVHGICLFDHVVGCNRSVGYTMDCLVMWDF